MIYLPYSIELTPGRFISRYKRFFVDVEREGGTKETIHCANSGSMKSCLEDFCSVYSLDSQNAERKLRHSLELMHLSDGLACLNTARANQFVESLFVKALSSNAAETSSDSLQALRAEFSQFNEVKREAKFSDTTRFDFLLSSSNTQQKAWVEIKSVSLRLNDSTVAFPDAKTERGQKHLECLMEAHNRGDKACLFFVVMRSNDVEAATLARSFRPAFEIDPKYAKLLDDAINLGVQVRLVIPSISLSGFGFRGYFPYPFSH